MSVVQLAKAQVTAERAAEGSRVHKSVVRKRDNAPIDGELQWIGELLGGDTRPCRLVFGDKKDMTAEEQRLFTRTPFERGFSEYNYSGKVRVVRDPVDDMGRQHHRPDDPRYAYREGEGVLQYPGGELYEGKWRVNRRHDEQGYMSTAKGYSIYGQFRDDVVQGPAKEKFSCKSRYEANYEDGLPEGKGMLEYASDYRYEGEFKNGRRHGKGSIYYPNGDVFECTFDQGKRHGRGVTTTLTAGGRPTQYETEWDQDVLIAGPSTIDKAKRTRAPKQTSSYSSQGLAPADLTKWKVKDDVMELPMEHFIRIKLGFEKLDVNGSGSLSTNELTAIWGDGSHDMLQKLDQDHNGTVELDEIFAGWYPNVPQHNINRFMMLDVKPSDLLMQRGCLAGMTSDARNGYMQLVGAQVTDDFEEDKALHLKTLDTAGYSLGGFKFSLAMFEAAAALCKPPHFLEVLEAWYPNIPRTTLARYEMMSIPHDELEAIKTMFYKLSGNKPELTIADFEDCQDRFRESDLDEGNVLDQHVAEGFFKGQPFWRLGSIRLSVQLLNDVDKFDNKLVGGVNLHQLLRYCFPNIRCKRTRELLAKKRKPGTSLCECQICRIN